MAFPDQTQALAAPAVILLAVLSNRKGAQQASRACGALFLLLAGLYAVIVLASLKNAEVRWMAPWGGARQTVRVIPAMLSLASLRYLPDRQGRTKGSWLGALTLLPAVLAAVTAGCLSPRLTQQLELPFYPPPFFVPLCGRRANIRHPAREYRRWCWSAPHGSASFFR